MPGLISSQNGIEGTRQRLEALDPQTTNVPSFSRLLGKPGQVYPNDPTPSPGTLATLVDGHNEVWKPGGLAEQVAALRSQPPTPFRVSG